MEVSKEAYTVRSFCEAYGISRSQVFEELKAGKLTAKKLGPRRLLIGAMAAAEWFENLPSARKETRNQKTANAAPDA